MSLFDIYNIENWNGGETSLMSKILPGVITTALGFALGRLPGYLEKRSNIKKAGKRFKAEVSTLLIYLKEQITDLNRCIKEYETKVPGKKVAPPTLNLLGRFKYLDSINKIDIIDFYEKEKDKGEDASVYVSTLYQIFEILEVTTKRVGEVHIEFINKIQSLESEYINEINGLRTIFVQVADSTGKPYTEDETLSYLYTLLFSLPPNTPPQELLEVGEKVIPKLLTDHRFANTAHEMYKPVLEFSVKAQRIIQSYKAQWSKLISFLQNANQTFKEASDDINENHKP